MRKHTAGLITASGDWEKKRCNERRSSSGNGEDDGSDCMWWRWVFAHKSSQVWQTPAFSKINDSSGEELSFNFSFVHLLYFFILDFLNRNLSLSFPSFSPISYLSFRYFLIFLFSSVFLWFGWFFLKNCLIFFLLFELGLFI